MKFEFFKAVSPLPDVVRLFSWRKDGGPESKVGGFFFFEAKRWFSIALLRFDEGSREAFHSHAFNCVSWVLWGRLREVHITGEESRYGPSLRPVVTKRTTFHQVFGLAPRTWVLTFRGPWKDTWHDFIPSTDELRTLTYGRKSVAS